jgi:hypothetical protein
MADWKDKFKGKVDKDVGKKVPADKGKDVDDVEDDEKDPGYKSAKKVEDTGEDEEEEDE